MKKKGIAEPVAAYAAVAPYDPLAESTKIAQSILDAAGIKAVDIVDEQLEDEYCSWISRIFYVGGTTNQTLAFNVKLAEEEARKNCIPTGNSVVMFLTAG